MKFISRLILVLALVFASGCSEKWSEPAQNGSLIPPTMGYVCVDLPQTTRPTALEAVAEWDHAVHNWKKLVIVDGQPGDSSLCSYWIHEVPEQLPEGQGLSDSSAAWTTVGGRDISMRRGRYEANTKGVLVHELGHALGAQHLPGTTMNPTYKKDYLRGDCPDAPTVAQVAAWNRVNIELLAWCN